MGTGRRAHFPFAHLACDGGPRPSGARAQPPATACSTSEHPARHARHDRADRMGFSESTRGLTPALDAFAGVPPSSPAYSAQAGDDRIARHDPHRRSYPAGHRVNDFGARCRGPCRIFPSFCVTQAIARQPSSGRDPRSTQRDGARIRPRLRRLRRGLPASPSRRRSFTPIASNGAARKSSAERSPPGSTWASVRRLVPVGAPVRS
jgi:hypothetical protein